MEFLSSCLREIIGLFEGLGGLELIKLNHLNFLNLLNLKTSLPPGFQLPLNVFGQFVLLQDVRRQVGGSLDKSKAVRLLAIALERLVHVPFGGGVEEADLFAFGDGPDTTQHPAFGVEEHVGIAAVVDVLQEARVEENVFAGFQLNGHPAWGGVDRSRFESGNDLSGLERFGGA